MNSRHFYFVVFSLLLIGTFSCGAPSRSCGPENCQGCCDAAGMCQVEKSVLACGAGGQMCSACAQGSQCQASGVCTLINQPLPDAGSIPDAGTDAGTPLCTDGSLMGNAGFECGLDGWAVVDGQAQTIAGGWNSAHALQMKLDVSGNARVALTKLIETTNEVSLCVGIQAHGTVETVHIDVIVLKTPNMTMFSAPVSTSWQQVPPVDKLRVLMPANTQAQIRIRAKGASPNDVLVIDELSASFTPGTTCP